MTQAQVGMEVDLNSTSTISVDNAFRNSLAERRGHRELAGAQGCVASENLQTPNEADTVVIGTMFTVRTHDDPISMQTMEIIANPVESIMNVKIYTKGGGFKGFENDSSKWIKIVDTSIVPAPREGRGTIIPPDEFIGFTMNPNEMRSFFVSLTTSDLRYRRADEFETGQPFVSDGYLSVNVGVGLAGQGFGSRIFPSRMFSGIFHYNRVADCNAPTSKTLLTYTFHVQPKAKVASKAEMTNEVEQRVGDALRDILRSDLSDLSNDHAISINRIDTSGLVFERGKCPVQKWHSCLSVESKITLSHRSTITGGQLQYMLLHQAPEITERAQQGTIRASYTGHQPLQTSIFVAFKGVPAGVVMDNEQKLFLEQVTTDYLDEQTVGFTNVNIIGTKITNQRGPESTQRHLRSLQEGSPQDDWIELSMDVLAMLVPPYAGKMDFVNIVDDAFWTDRKGYIEDLRTGRHRPGSLVHGKRGELFLGINNVNTRIPGSSTANSGASHAGIAGATSSESVDMSKVTVVVACLGGLVAAVGWIWYSIAKNSKEENFTDTWKVQLIDSPAGSSNAHKASLLSHNGPSYLEETKSSDDIPTKDPVALPLKTDRSPNTSSSGQKGAGTSIIKKAADKIVEKKDMPSCYDGGFQSMFDLPKRQDSKVGISADAKSSSQSTAEGSESMFDLPVRRDIKARSLSEDDKSSESGSSTTSKSPADGRPPSRSMLRAPSSQAGESDSSSRSTVSKGDEAANNLSTGSSCSSRGDGLSSQEKMSGPGSNISVSSSRQAATRDAITTTSRSARGSALATNENTPTRSSSSLVAGEGRRGSGSSSNSYGSSW